MLYLAEDAAPTAVRYGIAVIRLGGAGMLIDFRDRNVATSRANHQITATQYAAHISTALSSTNTPCAYVPSVTPQSKLKRSEASFLTVFATAMSSTAGSATNAIVRS